MPDVATSPAASLAFYSSIRGDHDVVLTSEALEFVSALHERFSLRVDGILKAREARQARIDAGELPDFLPHTREIREGEWKIARLPADLRDRRVEITGPTDRKAIISALNSGARVFVADCEDSLSPAWDSVIQGQVNLRDAVRREIEVVADSGKVSRLNQKTAVLMVCPRGWHLVEKHLSRNRQPVPAAFVDFGLYLFHNAHALLRRGTGPYFYLPRLESHLEARLWAEVFAFSEQQLALPHGTIRATVIIESLLAAFEMNEILYELRDHALGLKCGRPYSILCIQTCHRRGASAIGGMTAQIPIKDDPIANEQAMSRVRADKEREALDGHDGTWVAHPGLVPIARTVFDRLMQGPNQIFKTRKDVQVTAADLLARPERESSPAAFATT